MESNHPLKDIVTGLPQKPGVYQYLNKDGKVIYVGKAKKLKSRVSSYFNRDKHQSGKTRLLVQKISDIKVILVESEYEALLLENSLIKKHRPKYNIQWRDDKSYPYICVKNERFPRIFPTRNLIKDGSQYFGPYASVRLMNNLLDIIHKMHKFRTCNYNLSEENIRAGKFKVCLEYQIGNCLGPCEGLQTQEDYDQSVDNVRKLLKGQVDDLIKHFKLEMTLFSKAMDFEKAEQAKQKVETLERFRSRSLVVNTGINNVDVFAYVDDDKFAYVNFMKIVRGAIIQSHTLELKRGMEETKEELLMTAILALRDRFKSQSKEIYLPFELPFQLPDVTYHVPQRGDKRKIQFLAQKNARQFMQDRHRQQEKLDPDRRSDRILNTLKQDLNLDELPVHIECFDNSNIQGTNPVAACVVFKQAKPSKKDYRHFNIKTVEGPDDFASMEEVVYRRYKRLSEEGESLPQLVVIDGGKGQLSAAYSSLQKIGLEKQIRLIGIAKKLEEIFVPYESIPLYLDKRSESLKLIQNLRNEAHRFGITHHRSKRLKSNLKTSLTEIEGIGEQTAKLLLRHFKSIKRIREADLTEIENVVGPSKSKKVKSYFDNLN